MSDLTIFNHSQEQEILSAMDEIPFGNSDFMIKNLVVKHQTVSRNYRQVLLEIWTVYKALKAAQFQRRKLAIEKQQKQKTIDIELDDLKKELIQIEIEEMDFNILVEDKLIKDAFIELHTYYSLFKDMPKLTRETFEESEHEYHRKRAVQQSELEILSKGSVSEGNLQYILDTGLNPYEVLMDLKVLCEGNSQKVLQDKKESIPQLST